MNVMQGDDDSSQNQKSKIGHRHVYQLGKTAGERDSPYIMSSGDGDDILMIETLDRYEQAFKNELMQSGSGNVAIVGGGSVALNNDDASNGGSASQPSTVHRTS